jgi:hypothetical protein
LADFFEFVDGKLASAVGDDAFALNVFPRVGGEFGLGFHDAKNQREQIDVLVAGGRVQPSMIQMAGVFLGDLLCHPAQCQDVGVLLRHPVHEGGPQPSHRKLEKSVGLTI